MTPRIGKWNEGNRLHAWSAKGTTKLVLNQGSTGCPCVWDHLWRSTCRGPLMRVRLWRSICGGPLFCVPLHPAQVYPFTQPKRTPSSSQSVPLYPAKVYPSTQPKCNPFSRYYKLILSTPHHASLLDSCFSLHAKHGIQSEGGNIFDLRQIYSYSITVNIRSILTE